MATDLIARAMAANGGGGGTPTDAYSKTETDALLKNKVGFAEYKDNKISFYNSILKDNIIGEIDLPVDMVVDQIKTKFSQKFKFDETTYPDTENPNLDGKPVLVLAIKTSATADTFSFLNMESLVDVYTGGTTKSAIISVDPETGVITNVVRISAETGNRIVQKDDGLFVPNQSASDVSYSNTTSKLKATTTQAAIDETLNVANEKYSKPSTGIPSADMAQSVKDSLAKADTALQEVDKTELQGEIDDKLDKTAVLSDFSSEDLTNKVPSAQLVLDSFTKKVTTEAVDNDARIITVPENVDCFGSIAMIGGKTQKISQLVKDGTFENPSYWSTANCAISTANNVLTITKTATGVAFAYQSSEYEFDHVFYMAADIKNNFTSENVTLTMYAVDTIKESSNHPVVPNTNYVRAEVIRTGVQDTTKQIRIFINGNETGTVNVKNFICLDLTAMFGKGKEPSLEVCHKLFSGYVPTGNSLWNAPVTAVESVSANMATLYKAQCGIKTDSTLYRTTSGVDTYIVKVNRGYQYTFTKTDITVYAFYEEYPVLEVTKSYNEQRYVENVSATTLTNKTITSPIDGYMCFRSTSGKVGYCGFGDTPLAEYTPYNKTTINLSDIYGNLEEVFPDYGVGIGDVYNYIDLEKMEYHRRIRSALVKDFTWSDSSSVSHGFATYVVSDVKVTGTDSNVNNILIDIYDTTSRTGIFDKGIAVSSSKMIFVQDNSIANAATFKTTYGDKVMYYELAEEELIPLSSIIPPIHVEPNGTIEFVNEHNLDVPTKTIYKKTI